MKPRNSYAKIKVEFCKEFIDYTTAINELYDLNKPVNKQKLLNDFDHGYIPDFYQETYMIPNTIM